MPTRDRAPRLLVISDIHGHAEGLLRLLDEAGYDPSMDRLIMLGDYIDSEPATIQTLQTVKTLVEEGARAIPGNQETALMKYFDQQNEAAADKQSKLFRMLNHPMMDVQMMRWLKGLPFYIEEDDLIFVHAGLRPGVPVHHQSEEDLTEIREEFWGAKTRVVDRTVIFGHTPTFKLGAQRGTIWLGERKIGMDTGAKHGCRLTLLDVHGGIVYSCSTAAHELYSDLRIETLQTPVLR